MLKKILGYWKYLGVVVLIVVALSGWGYYLYKQNQLQTQSELAVVNNSFLQQYGTQAVVRQGGVVDKVYWVTWDDSSKVTHLSWCVAGYWFEVGSTKPLATSNSTAVP